MSNGITQCCRLSLAGPIHRMSPCIPGVQYMMTSSNGNIFALLAICVGNSPVPGEFPTQRPVMQSCDVFFDLRLNKRLSKQSWGWWFETLLCPLWHQCNDLYKCCIVQRGHHASSLSSARAMIVLIDHKKHIMEAICSKTYRGSSTVASNVCWISNYILTICKQYAKNIAMKKFYKGQEEHQLWFSQMRCKPFDLLKFNSLRPSDVYMCQ